ncbi:MAG: MATE family efflux transporter [Clostridia bacterium]|nr:MATE family efflux transporter [Clostridia bacterium]
MTKDLTHGKPLKVLIGFAIPVFLGSLFQQFYNMVDSAIVGRFVNTQALAGVGATGSINFMIMGFVLGMCTGFAVPIAQCFGAGDEDGVKRFFVNSIWISIVLSAVVTVFTLIFIDDILRLMKTPDDIFDYAKTYISTIFAGTAGMCAYNLLASVLRALGDSKTPVAFLIFASILNLILDLIFVLVFHMGVQGTSLATVLSQTISAILCALLIVKRYPILHPTRRMLKPEGSRIKKMCSIGIPMGLQFSITAIGSVCISAAINTLGSVYVAAITAGSKIHMLFAIALDSIGMTMATYTGQNVGAGHYKRIKQGIWTLVIAGTVYCLVVCVIQFFFGRTFALIFVSKDNTEIINCIYTFLIYNTLAYFFLSPLHITRNTIQGAGFSFLAMFAGVFEMVARCFVAFGLVGRFGYNAACLANPVAWLMADIFLIPACIYVMKRLKVMLPEKE